MKARLAAFLVALIFISKISFSFIPGFPREWSFLLFQGGLHPYLNFFLVMLGGLGLWRLNSNESEFNLGSIYKMALVALVVVLSLQSFLQIFLGAAAGGAVSTLGTLLGAYLLIGVYGYRIPQVLGIQAILSLLFRYSSICVFVSLLLMIFFPDSAWKGGRFIGVFKHIPHMVSCASIAFIFSLDFAQHKIWKTLTIPAAFYCLLLTGTRSAVAAAILAVVLVLILMKSKSVGVLFLKVTLLVLVTTFGFFFGGKTIGYLEDLARGEKSLMERQAQDGVASRWEEVERGWALFQQQPWLGQGLASKFSSQGEASVEGYNANKDPHNIFVSAGVIGGWPLLMYSFFAVFMLAIGFLKGLASRSSEQRMVAIFVATHFPILLIYHVHLSPGGIADRVYWLLFALLSL